VIIFGKSRTLFKSLREERFILKENILLTTDGTEIVRSFCLEGEIFVASEAEVLQKSCFESSKGLTELQTSRVLSFKL
jgi:hypothetical protein